MKNISLSDFKGAAVKLEICSQFTGGDAPANESEYTECTSGLLNQGPTDEDTFGDWVPMC